MKKNRYKKILTGTLASLALFSCATDEISNSDLDQNLLNSELSAKSTELPYSSITASTEQSSNPIANIYDSGSDYLTTRWSGFGKSAHVYVDFGTEVTVDYLKIAFLKGDERKAFFSYASSNNGSSYTEVGSKTSSGSTDKSETFDITNTETRYLRITFEGNSQSDWNSVADLSIYGTAGEGAVATTTTSTTCEAVSPSNKKAETTNNSAILTWDAISNIDHYNVRYRKEGSSSSYIYQTSLKTNTVTLTGLDSNEEYEWQMRSKCANGSASEYNDVTNIFVTNGSSSSETQTEEATPTSTTSTSTSTGGSVEDIIGNFWKVTVPVDKNGNGSPRDCSEYDCRNNNAIDLYDLNDVAANRDYSDYFYEENGWVVFKAFCGGATTTNSQYPRCELRGLDATGDDNYFDMDDYQELNVTVKVLSVPVERPEVNMVQIHGPHDEPLRIEYNTGSQGLHVTYNEKNTWDDVMNYSIGDELKTRVVVENGRISFWLENLTNGETYNNDFKSSDDTGYFKVGCYLQSSITYCDVKSNGSFCSNGGQSDDYDATGSVAAKDLTMIRDGQVYK